VEGRWMVVWNLWKAGLFSRNVLGYLSVFMALAANWKTVGLAFPPFAGLPRFLRV
jgi:hypothetical protein